MKKMIGITQRIFEASEYHELREGLALDWGRFFDSKRVVFLPLSYEVEFSIYMPYLCGVILSGGNDLFSLKPNPVNQMRDNYEENVIAKCLENKIPLLGICHGAQALAKYFKGEFELVDGHVGDHRISFDDGVFNGDFLVNSYHHFAIKSIGSDLRVLAKKDDGIEAFCHINLPVLAMMWHMEREENLSEPTKYMWQKFIDFCQK